MPPPDATEITISQAQNSIQTFQQSEMLAWATAEELYVRWQQEQEEFQVWQAQPSWRIGLNRSGMFNQKWITLAQRLSENFPVFGSLVKRMKDRECY